MGNKKNQDFRQLTTDFATAAAKVVEAVKHKDDLKKQAEKQLEKFAKDISPDLLTLRALAQNVKVEGNLRANDGIVGINGITLASNSDDVITTIGTTSNTKQVKNNIQNADEKVANYENREFMECWNELKEKLKSKFSGFDFTVNLSDLAQPQKERTTTFCNEIEIFDKKMKESDGLQKNSGYHTPLFTIKYDKAGRFSGHALLHVNFDLTKDSNARKLPEKDIQILSLVPAKAVKEVPVAAIQ